MEMSRREFMKAASVIAAAFGMGAIGIPGTREAEAAEGSQRLIWLQGQGCTGCSVSLLNTINYMSVDKLLTSTVDLNYHSTLMAGAGAMAVAAAESDRLKPGYILAIEGAIPTNADGRYCTAWPGMTFVNAVRRFAQNAYAILAIGSCASYGGMAAGRPNPTGAKRVSAIVSGKPIINIPGCAPHPDWIIGTVAYILTYKRIPPLDGLRRPKEFFGKKVHDQCPYREDYNNYKGAPAFGQKGCLVAFGCRGRETFCDCPKRKWNSADAGTTGVNWCIGSGTPCHGCTEQKFPDGMSPFFTIGVDGTTGATQTSGGGGEDDDDSEDGISGATPTSS